MELAALYQQHIETLQRSYQAVFEELQTEGLTIDGLLLHSGSEGYYFADDNHIPFRPVPHFAHWLPLAGPDHLLVYQPGKPLRLFRYVPRDFWYETPVDQANHWQSSYDLKEIDNLEMTRQALPTLTNFAYIGNNRELALEWGIAAELIQPRALMTRLDYNRSYKTAYEVECLRRANQRAARGHQAAMAAFQGGLSELEIHSDYLNAIGGVELDTPYGNIVALDEKAAILHYQQKRGKEAAPGHLMLIDAGAREFGYCSDITRTYLRDNQEPQFTEILARMETLQKALVAQVKVDISYIDLQQATHRGVAEILSDLSLIKLSADEIEARGFTQPFYPHGIGHHLGLQVHDVSGHYADRTGKPAPPPSQYPFLRNTRQIEAGQVFTIEPGFYFIPMLLTPFRNGADSHHFDWDSIDRLTPLGGIRIEDNIHVTESGPENLTRPYLA